LTAVVELDPVPARKAGAQPVPGVIVGRTAGENHLNLEGREFGGVFALATDDVNPIAEAVDDPLVDAGDCGQLPHGAKRADPFAIGDDALRQVGADAGKLGEGGRIGGVHIDFLCHRFPPSVTFGEIEADDRCAAVSAK